MSLVEEEDQNGDVIDIADGVLPAFAGKGEESVSGGLDVSSDVERGSSVHGLE